jgi:hypothetical protein
MKVQWINLVVWVVLCEVTEIDQEMFENADGVQGIDQLVGVGVQENREGWQFWTQDVSSR